MMPFHANDKNDASDVDCSYCHPIKLVGESSGGASAMPAPRCLVYHAVILVADRVFWMTTKISYVQKKEVTRRKSNHQALKKDTDRQSVRKISCTTAGTGER